MARKQDYEACNDPRANTCLMCMDGRLCKALNDTRNCTFYKDKREMSDLQIAEYDEELWTDDYKGCSAKTAGRYAAIGAQIRKEYERMGII